MEQESQVGQPTRPEKIDVLIIDNLSGEPSNDLSPFPGDDDYWGQSEESRLTIWS